VKPSPWGPRKAGQSTARAWLAAASSVIHKP